ncbi:ABC transporter substrate-binding protein [Thalassobacillus sp. B23F22_16]|uniref:ABC transporter substrate-binding protein n=1 Tax=Thalassobacillus sp. B23F22_16 TaxID=3459513 RepID=UPI00373F0C0D
MKKFLGIFTFFSLILLMVACNGDEGESTGDDGEVTLQFWGGVPAENGPQEAVDKWNEENPDVQVEYTRYVNDEDGNLKVNTALQTGEELDILMSHSPNDYEQRVDSGFLMDLSDKDVETYIEENIGSAASKWKMKDSYYALPTNINAIFIMMNQDVLEEKGIDIPEKLTWEELQDIAKQLKGEFEYPYALDSNNIHGIVQNALIDEGFVGEDGKSNLDHPNVKKGLEITYQMMHEDEVMPKLSEQEATNMAPEQMFLNGEIGLYQAGAWRLRLANDLDEYPRDFKIAFVPYPNFEGQSTPAHHVEDAMSIVAESEHPDEAWEFIQWYAEEGMIELAPGGRVPASEKGPQEEAREMIISGKEDTYNVDSLNRTYEVENTAILLEPNYQVLDNINQELEKYFLGNQSIDETIENMVSFHNDYLSRN